MKNDRNTSSGSASAAIASRWACSFNSPEASDVATSPGYCGKPSFGYVARVSSG
jgi:hypothetical protein